MAKRKGVTADELLRRLEANPEWVARRDERAARRADRAKQIEADEAPLIADLLAVGVPVLSVYDFINIQFAPDRALPVLVRHLQIEHHPRTREGIIRSLGIPSARASAFDSLCEAFRTEDDPVLRWTIANALAGMSKIYELSHLPGISEYASLFDTAK